MLPKEIYIGSPETFPEALAKQDIALVRGETTTLQINVGLLCNQRCKHCHLSAGPDRREIMNSETADEVVAYARRGNFETIDITGGAPELNPHISRLIEELSAVSKRMLFRSNLTALTSQGRRHLLQLLREKGVVIVASLPSLNEAQTDSQRGKGAFKQSVHSLLELNGLGYGEEGSGLELNLVSNPTGAFLPPPESQTEKRFRQVLENKWGITFNRLFSLANMPIGRFQEWLVASGNLEDYRKRLVSAFNPNCLEGVMCRTLHSVSWDGYLFDCDFNLARNLYLGGQRSHISDMPGPPRPGTPIAVANHCYTCTAGEGFT
jgi:radical SAM/Cys-rich protein